MTRKRHYLMHAQIINEEIIYGTAKHKNRFGYLPFCTEEEIKCQRCGRATEKIGIGKPAQRFSLFCRPHTHTQMSRKMESLRRDENRHKQRASREGG